MGRKPDPKYMPVCRQDIWPSPNAFSKKDWLTSIILLHRKCCPNFNQPVYPARSSSYERRTLETCARNTYWRYTESSMLWEAFDILEKNKEMKFVF